MMSQTVTISHCLCGWPMDPLAVLFYGAEQALPFTGHGYGNGHYQPSCKSKWV